MEGNTRLKHVPQRMCVVCRDKDAKRSLTRLVRTPDGGVVIDKSGKLSGRGAYICDRKTCWERVLKSDVLEKALRARFSTDDRERLRNSRLQDEPK
jgi:uncharacterized protein